MKTLNDEWVDLYALLGVAVDADEQTLEKKIRKFESEYADELRPQLPAQCRRILLDEDTRMRYNRVRRHHLNRSPAAMDFQAFVSTVQGDDSRRKLVTTPVAPTAPAPVPPHTMLGTPVMSRNSIYLLTGVVATMLMTYIQTGSNVLPGQ
jgi:hypothetical protein